MHYPEGILTHTLQTYLRLRNSGYHCVLVDQLPRRGLVVSHRVLLNWALFSPDLFLVNMLADRGPHGWAQAVVTQNPRQAVQPRHFLIPQWPQPGLIKRDPERGQRFEVVAYFGRPENLAPELRQPQWAERLRRIGLEWRIVGHPRHDYHEVDAVVAVRDFAASHVYDFKPAAKLVNAWLAGAIALAAPEPAHLVLRQCDLDYVSVNSVDDLFSALVTLKATPELRHRLVERGFERGAEFTAERTTERWRNYLDEVAWPQYRAWLSSSRSSRWLYYTACCAHWPFGYRARTRIKKDWFRW